MSSNIKAIIKSDLLVWARKSAGLSIEEASKKAQIKPDRLKSWEEGDKQPTVIQLRKLAQIYKRPLAVFYLSEPPKTFDILHDFRRLPDKLRSTESPHLKLEIRLAQYRRQIALDLYNMLGEDIPKFIKTVNLSEDTENVASNIRKFSGIHYDEQVSWKNEYEAFNQWRSALENLGVLIFQARKVELSEMRGFSITDAPLPVIVLNINDSPKGRIFTMLHEFVHLMLKESGLCNLEEDGLHQTHESEVEIFCNQVAGAALIPMRQLLAEDIVTGRQKKPEWDDTELDKLASRYKASREVVLRRLLIAQLTTEAFYRQKRKEFQKEYEALGKKEGGFAPPHIIALASAGNHFVNLVLDSYYREKITTSALSDYLNIRLEHLPKIQTEMRGREAQK
jgi:Zn-dependent peptidase ImmA (M78 family)/transcriptional regulator with XRE-family HTH domain